MGATTSERLPSTGCFAWRVQTDEIRGSEDLYRSLEFDPKLPVTLELIGARIHSEDLPSFHETIERARSRLSRFECSLRLRLADNTVKHLHVLAQPTHNAEGQPEYLGVVQDMTERRRSEEVLPGSRAEIARVSRAISLAALAASITHEVNQPLTGILANASACWRMLHQDPPDVEGARETAVHTMRDAERASEVIKRVRALFGKNGAPSESLDLNEATREVLALSLAELRRNRVTLRTELADGLPPVQGDRVQLQQVILNLLLNASEAMTTVDNRPRLLVVKTGPDQGQRVYLSVQDAGVGFEPQYIDRLFEAFYTTKKDGMGIGLSVSRSIIEIHHGRLSAALNEGPGATFSFSIPRASSEATAAPGSRTPRALPVGRAEHTTSHP